MENYFIWIGKGAMRNLFLIKWRQSKI